MPHENNCECYVCNRERRIAAGMCPSCPAKIDGQHKFSCSYVSQRVALPVVERSDGKFEVALPKKSPDDR